MTSDSAAQRRILAVALTLNATMFFVGLAAGLWAQSSSLVADSLDMLADAIAYGIALLAVQRGALFQGYAAKLSGLLLFVLGASALIDAVRRGLMGSNPNGSVMMATALLSLIVNLTVFHLLGKIRKDGVHLKAAWVFTRADVIANSGVILSGAIVALTGFRHIDIVVGSLIALYVLRESFEILTDSKRTPNPVSLGR